MRLYIRNLAIARSASSINPLTYKHTWNAAKLIKTLLLGDVDVQKKYIYLFIYLNLFLSPFKTALYYSNCYSQHPQIFLTPLKTSTSHSHRT